MLAALLFTKAHADLSRFDKIVYTRRSAQWPRANPEATLTSSNALRNGRMLADVRWDCDRTAMPDFPNAWDPETGLPNLDQDGSRGQWEDSFCKFYHKPKHLQYFVDFMPRDADIKLFDADGNAIPDTSTSWKLIKSHFGLLKNSSRLPGAQPVQHETELFQIHNHVRVNVTLLHDAAGTDFVVPLPYDTKVEPNRERYELSFDTFDAAAFGGPILNVKADHIFGFYAAMSTFSNLWETYDIDGLRELVNTPDYVDPTIVNQLHRNGYLMLPYESFEIKNDRPLYSHRGVMIDTARAFQPVEVILNILNYMHSTKLNVLHWHATDDQSFPLLLATYRRKEPATNNILEETFYPEIVMDANNSTKRGMNATELVHGPRCAGKGESGDGVCHGAYGKGLTYDLSDLALINSVAWNYGIRVVYEIDSPSHARSWGASERSECHKQRTSRGAYTSLDWTCPANDDGPESEMINMCHGNDYQLNAEVCVQQPCGPLNLRVDNGSLSNSTPLSMFHTFMRSLKEPMGLALSHFDALLFDSVPNYSADLLTTWAQAFPSASFVPDGELFHIGLDEVHTGCLDGYNLSEVFNPTVGNPGTRTAAGMLEWVPGLTDTVTGAGNISVAWHDALTHYPKEISGGIIPQIWDSTVSNGEFAWSDMFREEDDEFCRTPGRCIGATDYIWSPSTDMYLDCALGNNAVAGFNSWCSPWKTYWQLFHTDPNKFAEIQNSTPRANALGAEVPLWGEQGTHDNYVERMFPRAAAMAAPLWHGIQDESIGYASWANVLDTFDFSDIYSQDFDDEYEWIRWTLSMGATGMDLMPEKTMYCAMDVYMGDANCRKFGKSVYDFEVARWDLRHQDPKLLVTTTEAPGPEPLVPTPEPVWECLEPDEEDQQTVVVALASCFGISVAVLMVGSFVALRHIKKLKRSIP